MAGVKLYSCTAHVSKGHHFLDKPEATFSKRNPATEKTRTLNSLDHFVRYIKPDFLDITEFLQEVTSPDGAQWLSPGHSPLDLGGFVSAYEATPHYADILRVVNSPDSPCVLSVKAPKPLRLTLRAEDGAPVIAQIEAGSPLTSAEQTVHFTGAVKEGDVITAVSAPEGGLVYLAGKGGGVTVDEVKARLHEAADPVRLQLERAAPMVRDIAYCALADVQTDCMCVFSLECSTL